MPLWTIVYVVAFWPLLFAVFAACWRWGGAEHRQPAAALTLAMLADLATVPWHRFTHFDAPAALIDLALLLALTRFAMRWPRWWLLTMAALQCLATAGHLARLLDHHMSQLAYALLAGSGGYFQLILLSIGLLLGGPSRQLRVSRRA